MRPGDVLGSLLIMDLLVLRLMSLMKPSSKLGEGEGEGAVPPAVHLEFKKPLILAEMVHLLIQIRAN